MVDVDESAFGVEAAVTRLLLPDAVLEDPAQRVYAARVDGRLVWVGESTTLDGVVGVFGVATESRLIAGAGFAPRSRRSCSPIARVKPTSRCSTPRDLGEGVYARLGFAAMSTWEVWVREAPPA